MVVIAVEIFRPVIRRIVRERMFFMWSRLIWCIVIGIMVFLWIEAIVT